MRAGRDFAWYQDKRAEIFILLIWGAFLAPVTGKKIYHDDHFDRKINSKKVRAVALKNCSPPKCLI
jgi:hypothetical protein